MKEKCESRSSVKKNHLVSFYDDYEVGSKECR